MDKGEQYASIYRLLNQYCVQRYGAGKNRHDIKKAITGVEFEVRREMEICETYECVFPEDVAYLALEIAEAHPETFEMCGVIDTSASAGEYMKFHFSYVNGVLTEKMSDWYVEEYMEDYEDYEDFTQYSVFEDVTEEEFNLFKTYEYLYILETKDGNVFSDHVPFSVVREYKIV